MRALLLLFILLASFEPKASSEDILKLFIKNPTYSNVKISPDGKYFGTVTYIDGKRVLIFIDTNSFTAVNAVRFPGNSEVGEYYWVNNERVVIKMAESQPWLKAPSYYGELFAVNWDGSKAQMIYGYRAGLMQTGSNIKKRESTKGWADIISVLPDNDKQILISSTPWSNAGERLAEVLLLDVYTGRTRRVSSAPAPYSSFIINQKHELTLATSVNSLNEQIVYVYNKKSSDWIEIPQNKFGNRFSPISSDDTGDIIYVLDNFNQDKLGLFELKLSDFSYKPIYTDAKVDISDYEITKDTGQVFALRLDDGGPSYVLLSEQYVEARIFKDLLTTFNGNALSITSKTQDGNLWVIQTSSDTDAGSYLLYNRKENAVTKLFDAMPELAKVTLMETEPVEFDSFDGKKIHGYYTRGKGNSKNKPLVVNVHGGPHGVRDYWGFDPEVQLLANAGYSVLQVNYRGSGGYGLTHQISGYHQWGDAIQQDIITGTKWAIDTERAQANNICIMGASFGGYSAIQAATLSPDLYQCIIGVVGVYDLNLMRSSGDIPLRSFGIAYLDQAIGTNPKTLETHSPINNVNKLKSPMLIAHGKRDKRAPLEHAEALRKAMDNAGKEYQWLLFNDEAHGFYSEENRLIYFNELIKFLDRNLKK